MWTTIQGQRLSSAEQQRAIKALKQERDGCGDDLAKQEATATASAKAIISSGAESKQVAVQLEKVWSTWGTLTGEQQDESQALLRPCSSTRGSGRWTMERWMRQSPCLKRCVPPENHRHHLACGAASGHPWCAGECDAGRGCAEQSRCDRTVSWPLGEKVLTRPSTTRIRANAQRRHGRKQ